MFRDFVLAVFLPVLCSLLTAMPTASGGSALEFDGVDDYVETPITDVPMDGTVEAWVNTTRSDVRQAVISSHGGEEFRVQLHYRPGKQGVTAGFLGLNVLYRDLSAHADIGSEMYDGSWHHVAFVWEGGSPGTIRAYWDGQEKTVVYRTHGNWAGNYNRTAVHVIGREDLNNNNYFFVGKIDEVRFWSDRARTGAEIQEYMNKELLGDEEGLRGYWKFNEGEGTTAFDSSPNENHGTIAGALWTTEIAPVALALPRGLAYGPAPADGVVDVPREVALSWEPGEYAPPVNGHIVYLSDNFNDVNDGIGGITQDANSYAPSPRLELGTTYYWRVDEVNAPPDSTIFKGEVWSFTTEPIGYPIENITVTASSEVRAEEGAENTINGSGLDDDDLHSAENSDMWLSDMSGTQPTWIQYEFDKVYKLHQMQIWNYNSSVEPVIGFGIREATVEYSADGANWAILGTTHEFARGPGADGYAPNTTVDLGGVAAKYVKITANSNWGGMVNQYGLSEVRFFYIPVSAREPNPASGAADVSVDATLSWRAGREAAKHKVYLSTDEQAVLYGTAPVTDVTSPSYTSSLDLASTYYWRIDEVNDAGTPTTWQGDIWNLSTQEYLVVDDFESYNDIPTGQEGSNLVYETWVDGFGTTTNGSTIGYTEAFQPSMEKTVVYDGKQSVPLFYNNTTASYSEVTANVADLQAGQDWARHGIKGLTLRFSGDPNNVPQQMYVKVNNAKVTYDGDAENIRRTAWQMWYIDLASDGMSLSNVTTLTIGFERIGTLGGQGVILLDGIRLYSYGRQSITPVDPGTAGLQAQYQFEGNTNDSSGKGRNGTAQGDPLFVAGKVGQAISLDGFNDYVTITGYKGILADAGGVQQPCTVMAWVKTADSGDRTIASWGTNSNMLRVDFRLAASKLRVEHGGGNVVGNTALNDGEWHHVALTMIRGATVSYPDVTLWLDGKDDTRATTDADPFSITAGVDMAIGYCATAAARYFLGAIDDVRMYDRELTQGEVASLAGKTKPFDKPF